MERQGNCVEKGKEIRFSLLLDRVQDRDIIPSVTALPCDSTMALPTEILEHSDFNTGSFGGCTDDTGVSKVNWCVFQGIILIL